MAHFVLTYCLVAGLLSTSLTPSWGYVPPSSLCPDSWAEFEGRCYKYFPALVTWSSAKQNCRVLGSGRELASVHNAAENTFLFFFALSQAGSEFATQRSGVPNRSFWINVNDIDEEGTFIGSDGSQVDYTDWFSGEPNNNSGGNEDCVHIWAQARGLGWNDTPCTGTLPYICEIATPCSE